MFYSELISLHPNIVFSSDNPTYRPKQKARACPVETSRSYHRHPWFKATSLKESEFTAYGDSGHMAAVVTSEGLSEGRII